MGDTSSESEEERGFGEARHASTLPQNYRSRGALVPMCTLAFEGEDSRKSPKDSADTASTQSPPESLLQSSCTLSTSPPKITYRKPDEDVQALGDCLRRSAKHLQVHQFSPLPSGRRHSSHNLSPVSTIAESTDEEDTDSAEGRSPGRTQSAKNTRRMRRHQRRMSFPPPAHRSTQQHWTSRMNDRLPSSFNSLTRSASPSPTGSLTNLNEDAEAQFSSSESCKSSDIEVTEDEVHSSMVGHRLNFAQDSKGPAAVTATVSKSPTVFVTESAVRPQSAPSRIVHCDVEPAVVISSGVRQPAPPPQEVAPGVFLPSPASSRKSPLRKMFSASSDICMEPEDSPPESPHTDSMIAAENL